MIARPRVAGLTISIVMRVLRHPTGLPESARGAVIAIGNFDGVHNGHVAVIDAARIEAQRLGRPMAVLTFAPHPRRFFHPGQQPFLLTRLRTKLRLFAGLGVELVYVLRFDARLAGVTAEQFVDDLLVAQLAARHVAVGYDFVFGKGRAGRADLLRTRLALAGVTTTTVAPVARATGPHAVFSSTAARDALAAGDLPTATAILGRPFAIEGRVAVGDRRGRTIGFPTANLWLGEYVRPRFGVYAVCVDIAGRAHAGVANLGLRPTFGGDREPRLEVHLLDFAGDLYGRRICVDLLHFLRAEQKFDGIDALKAQIALDAAQARTSLAGGCGAALPSL